MAYSKKLTSSDESGFHFAQEMLQGDPTSAINFDRIQKTKEGGYIIFEYLLCEEAQKVTPHTSHPNRYWHLNSMKFISLWDVAQALDAKLYLVNYAKQGTKHEDKILLIEVLDLDKTGILKEIATKYDSREDFSNWFRSLNKSCL